MNEALGMGARKAMKAISLPFGLLARPDLSILAYHRVGSFDGEISTPIAQFERQLRWLSTNASVVALDAALEQGASGVVITFDDGYRDVAEVVAPLLERYRLPATLYLATSLVRDDGGRDRLTWPILREATANGLITVGSHTHGHANLSRASERDAAEEMIRSKELIEDRLAMPCVDFAYPWSVGSPAADRAARRLFRSAALHAWRGNVHEGMDAHRLGRVPILRSDGMFFFREKVRGRLDGEGVIYRVARRGPWREDLHDEAATSSLSAP